MVVQMNVKFIHIFNDDFYNSQISLESKQWVEDNFPEKNYGKDIFIYEAWPMRSLLEMAFEIGGILKNKALLSENENLKRQVKDFVNGRKVSK